ncbi:MAG: WGR domain-containing protein [Polyangiaceae bacterium]
MALPGGAEIGYGADSMRIVEQTRLWYRQGNSDKVYEVDLVEVASGQFVVNFRYGRRGTALRDGTKTPLPVGLEQARAVWTALVTEKTNKGYQRIVGSEASLPNRPVRTNTDRAASRARAEKRLIESLRLGHRSEIPLHLVVRQVGERALPLAEAPLLELLASGSAQSSTKPEVLKHWVVAALARCGTARIHRAAARHCRRSQTGSTSAGRGVFGSDDDRRFRGTSPCASRRTRDAKTKSRGRAGGAGCSSRRTARG